MRAIDVTALAVQVLLHDGCKHQDRSLLLTDPVGTIMRMTRQVQKQYRDELDDEFITEVGDDD